MSSVAYVLISLGVLSAVSLLAGWLLWRLWDWSDDTADALQTKINRLENRFAAAGASWMAELLEAAVVGDEEQLVRKAEEFFEADDTTDFFLRNIAAPCAVYAIRETGDGAYPDLWDRISRAYGAQVTAATRGLPEPMPATTA